MSSKKDRAIVVSALKHAAPYIRLFKGKVFVLKVGGEVFADAGQTRALMEQVGILHQVGIRVVLVHGGGPQSTALASALGLDTTFVDGRRVTDGPSLDVATMVLNGQINTRVLAACRELQIPAVGISGVDAGFIRASRRPPVEREGDTTVDYGFVGDIDSIDADIVRKQLDNGLMPVISPLSCDESGEVFLAVSFQRVLRRASTAMTDLRSVTEMTRRAMARRDIGFEMLEFGSTAGPTGDDGFASIDPDEGDVARVLLAGPVGSGLPSEPSVARVHPHDRVPPSFSSSLLHGSSVVICRTA